MRATSHIAEVWAHINERLGGNLALEIQSIPESGEEGGWGIGQGRRYDQKLHKLVR